MWRREPTMAATALRKILQRKNRFALLAYNLEANEEAVINDYVRDITNMFRDEVYEQRKASWEKYVQSNDDSIRLSLGFTKKEWESLTKQFERRPENADWYQALQESLKADRLDCRKISFPIPEGFKNNMSCELATKK